MRRLVGTCLVLLTAAHGGAALADPDTPQLTPLHRQRDDARRLRDQLRGLDGEDPTEPATVTALPSVPAPARPGSPVQRGVGAALLVVAGLSGLTALSLYAASSGEQAPQSSSYDPWKGVFAATTLVAGVTGLTLVLANRTVQVTPTAAPTAVGLAIAGRL